ncbi:MAG: hypothetical protein Q8876_08570 [Bacillota bacterium]|nr:hypothetical protein [Bacillota bacterium]
MSTTIRKKLEGQLTLEQVFFDDRSLLAEYTVDEFNKKQSLSKIYGDGERLISVANYKDGEKKEWQAELKNNTLLNELLHRTDRRHLVRASGGNGVSEYYYSDSFKLERLFNKKGKLIIREKIEDNLKNVEIFLGRLVLRLTKENDRLKQVKIMSNNKNRPTRDMKNISNNLMDHYKSLNDLEIIR